MLFIGMMVDVRGLFQKPRLPLIDMSFHRLFERMTPLYRYLVYYEHHVPLP